MDHNYRIYQVDYDYDYDGRIYRKMRRYIQGIWKRTEEPVYLEEILDLTRSDGSSGESIVPDRS